MNISAISHGIVIALSVILFVGLFFIAFGVSQIAGGTVFNDGKKALKKGIFSLVIGLVVCAATIATGLFASLKLGPVFDSQLNLLSPSVTAASSCITGVLVVIAGLLCVALGIVLFAKKHKRRS